MQFLKYVLQITLATGLVPESGLACSVLTLSDTDETLTGYTMEWPGFVKTDETNGRHYLGGGVFLLERGLEKKPVFAKDSTFRWTSKYRSIVLSVLGPSYSFNGVNETGLEVYELGPPSLNRDPQSKGPVVSEGDLMALLLDQAKDVDEAIAVAKSISMEQYLFPIQYYVKDLSGNVVILDYKNGLRVHRPQEAGRSVTNFYYDEEREMLSNGTRPVDWRFWYIAENAKKPSDMEAVLTKVATELNTQWQTFSSVKGNEWLYTIRVNSKRIPYAELTKDLTLDLKKIFSEASYPHKVQVFLFSDILKQDPVQFRSLEPGELQKIQQVNLYNIGRYTALFARNEERDMEIWENYLELDKAAGTAPFDNLVGP